MSARYQAPPATEDWLPPRVALRRRAIDEAVQAFEPAGYRQIVTPTFEETAVFSRTAGGGSDVVRKEMYTFTDRGGRELTLRPEGTAPVVRAYLQHGLAREPQPVRLWYVAPMFRYARAQRGRYREHWQFGVEALGSDDPAVDAEVIALQAAWYRRLGLEGVELRLNSIGDAACRPAYRERLVAYLRAHAGGLSADSRERLEVNPLRVFDSKDPRDHEVLREAPRISEHLCDECRVHFEDVRAFLDARALAYTLDSTLVRGLDYYERTTWEFVWEPLGAQSALGGGGRYDGLAEQLGGGRTPGVGFGAGIERTVLAMEAQGAAPPAPACDWYCAIEEPAARPRLLAELDAARARGIAAEADLGGRSLKGQLRQAGRLHARVLTVCTARDWARGIVTADGEELAVDGLVDEVERRLRG